MSRSWTAELYTRMVSQRLQLQWTSMTKKVVQPSPSVCISISKFQGTGFTYAAYCINFKDNLKSSVCL